MKITPTLSRLAAENCAAVLAEKETEMLALAEEIFNNQRLLAEHEKGQELIEAKIDQLQKAIQQEISGERCPETGKFTHSNDLARKSELSRREQAHQPLQMLKADRLNHLERTKNLCALIEFQRRQFTVGEKMLEFWAGQN